MLLTTTHLLSVLLAEGRLSGGGVDPGAPVRATLNPFGLRFSIGG